jgi:hypothetical protein
MAAEQELELYSVRDWFEENSSILSFNPTVVSITTIVLTLLIEFDLNNVGLVFQLPYAILLLWLGALSLISFAVIAHGLTDPMLTGYYLNWTNMSAFISILTLYIMSIGALWSLLGSILYS